MNIDSKNITNKILKKVKARTTALNLQYVYPSLSLIRTSKNSYHKYYMNNLKKYCRECGIKINVIDVLNDNKEEAIQVIEKLNSDFNINGIILETPNETLANNIVPFKDIDCLSIPNAGSLMTKDDITQPCIAKGIFTLLDSYNVKINHSRVLIITDSDNPHYIKYITEMFRREHATVILANKNTRNLSSLLYDSNIILIANNKVNSFGYEMLDDINYEIEQDIIHNIQRSPAYVIDLGIHKNSLNEINGNVQYNNTDDIFKFAYLKNIYILPVLEFINLGLVSALENTLTCANIQKSMLTKSNSYI
jgi:5,10-methylene-tetrahydrofolate dehydrogenase/methenyl tetrahydrofolate cyclohydrolase